MLFHKVRSREYILLRDLVRYACARRSASRLITAAIPLFLAVVALLSMGCDPSHGITYENRTGGPLTILKNGRFNLSLSAMETRTLETIEFDEAEVEAKNEAGQVIYSKTFTWEELKAAGWRIVITEPSLSGSRTPEATRRASPSPR